MFLEVEYEDIDNNKIDGSYKFIDVRSPGEYEAETIPGAINIPIFDNEERKIIGTIYDNESVEKAKKLGVEYVSKKLPQIYEIVHELDNQYDNLIFFCARGGYRSNSIYSLFRSIGVNAIKLHGGYKGYRRYVNENLPKLIDGVEFIVLYGNTGSGKTEILHYLEDMGMDILNLEKCANHRGSLFGSVGLDEPHNQKMFESLLFEALRNRKSNIIFTEGESKRIGKVLIPDDMFQKMKSGTNVIINTDIETRVNIILRDYTEGFHNEELIESLNHLRKRLGNKTIDTYIEMVNKNSYGPVIKDLMEKYYDPMYEFKDRKYINTFKNVSSQETAKNIVEYFEPEKLASM